MSSRRRRRSGKIAASVVAVSALAVGAFAAVTGGSGNDVVASPFSLVAAAEDAVAARTVEFDLTMSASDVASVEVSGAVDNDAQLISITTDLSSLLPLGDMALPFDGGRVTLLADGDSGTVYLDAESLGGFLPSSVSWVSIDLGALAEQSGKVLDDLSDELALDPSELARTLLESDDVVEVGADTIDGAEVMRYEVTVDVATALGELPRAELDEALDDLDLPADLELPDLAGLDLPDSLTYDVWVTADNQLRRVGFDTEIAGQSLSMQLDLTAGDEPLGLELPDDSDVFDLSGLLGF